MWVRIVYFQLCKPSAPRLIDGNQDNLAFGECAGATVHLRTSTVRRKEEDWISADGGEELLQEILCQEKLSLIKLSPNSSIPEQQSQSGLRAGGLATEFGFYMGEL